MLLLPPSWAAVGLRTWLNAWATRTRPHDLESPALLACHFGCGPPARDAFAHWLPAVRAFV
eukprot:713221-Lingulodinium_polyedra.AAC.1